MPDDKLCQSQHGKLQKQAIQKLWSTYLKVEDELWLENDFA